MYTILICDDDRDIVSALDIYLTSEGYQTLKAYNGREAIRAAETHEIHLILMDIMMPELDGIRATAKLREGSNVPIILLTAKSEDTDKILGLNIGADDYITKPFNPLEVIARVKSQLRRYTALGGAEKGPGLITAGPIAMDDGAKVVTVDGESISLTPIEYNILKLLLSHPGQVFSSAQIYEQVWNDPAYGSENTVAVHIRHLREKIEINPAEPRYLKVVWGLGYKIEKGAGEWKKLQGSVIAKACAWIVLLAAAFAACVFGVRALLSAQAVFEDNWQYSARYQNALANRRQELMTAIELVQQMNYLEQKITNHVADAATYADLDALQEQREEMEERFSRENTWFRFRVLDAEDGKLLGSNLKEDEAIVKAVRLVHRFTFELTERMISDNIYPEDYSSSNYAEVPPEGEANQNSGDSSQPTRLVLEYGVPEEVRESIQDEFYLAWQAYEFDRSHVDEALTGFLNLSALALVALIWILWTAGHKTGQEGIVTTWQERIWFDLYAAAAAAVGTFCLFGTVWATQQVYFHSNHQFYWAAQGNGSLEPYEPLGIMGAAAMGTCIVAVGALLLRTLAARLKAGSLVRSTLLCRVWGWTVRTVHEFVRALPITWKVVAGFGIYVLGSYFLVSAGRYDGWVMMIFWFLQLVLLFFLGWWAYSYQRLRQGTKTIAKGDLEYQIDTQRMPYDLRLQAEDLNNISVGLSSAVDEKMKSERFKAELITNVSHDLKTPLTSIINYVNLLKSTDQTDPKAAEYIEVLDRKSQRLKKLTEDLVEASKASTGVLSVTREKIGMSQLIDQALAEWEEKLTARKLTLVTTLPEGESWVYADGRHLWRVIDNLLSNCAKYAMEGTRVYLDLERGKGQVSLSVKNISREPLNVPPERLMERFVRGEESRSTEGSGLGLSIARSLTELQGGGFELAVDGDLFKAIVTLSQAS